MLRVRGVLGARGARGARREVQARVQANFFFDFTLLNEITVIQKPLGFRMLVMGHSLIRALVCSHRSLVRSLALSLAPELVGQ